MHVPEASFRRRTFRRLGRLHGVSMHLLQWIVPIHEAHLPFESLEQHFDGRRSLFAVRTLEVAVLHHHDTSVGGTELMICGIHRLDQVHDVALSFILSDGFERQVTQNAPTGRRRPYGQRGQIRHTVFTHFFEAELMRSTHS